LDEKERDGSMDQEEPEDVLADEIRKELESLGGGRKKSRLRDELEAALKKAELGGGALILLNLENDESLTFDSYPEALEHMGKHKGRWYLAPRKIDWDSVKR